MIAKLISLSSPKYTTLLFIYLYIYLFIYLFICLLFSCHYVIRLLEIRSRLYELLTHCIPPDVILKVSHFNDCYGYKYLRDYDSWIKA